MEKNQPMELLLAQWQGGEELTPYEMLSGASIRRYKNHLGEAYYLTGVGENPLHPTTRSGAALMGLEWERNCLRLTGESAVEVARLGLLQAQLWESVLRSAFPKIPFCLLGQVDYGEEAAQPAVELRFWAHRIGPAPSPDFRSIGQPAFFLKFI